MHAGQSSTLRRIKDYYPYSILHKITSSFHHSYTSTTNANNHQSHIQDQKSDTATVKERETKEPFLTRIIIVDDEPDVTLTLKVGLEVYCYHDNERRRFEVYSYNDPEIALSKFKPNFYDLLLTDIYMPRMDGFELSQRIVEKDANIRVCFMSSAEVNTEALREVYPKISFGCFIQKPVEMEYLVKRLLAELD